MNRDYPMESTIAIIGGGRWGHVTLSEFVKANSSFTHVVSVCGYNAESIDNLLTKLRQSTDKKLTRCDSVEQLLQQHSVQAAIVVNAPVKHYQTATLLLENDIPILIEKPVVLDTTEAEDLVARARSKGLALVPALNYGYLEYLKNFSKHISKKKQQINSFTIKWADPLGKFRFFQDVKKASGGISFIQEVMPHHWTMIHIIFQAKDIHIVARDSASSEKKHIYKVVADGIPGTIIISEEAPERLRSIDVNYTDQSTISAVFTDEPGIIVDAGQQINACPDWEKLKSPLVQEYEYFISCLGQPIKPNDAAALVESTRFTEDAYNLITALV